jgi:hypothetical protein
MTIKVDSQSRSLAAGKNVQLEVGRQFTWQIDGRDPERGRISPGEWALEVVIRY